MRIYTVPQGHAHAPPIATTKTIIYIDNELTLCNHKRSMEIATLAQEAGKTLDAIGIFIILAGVVLSTVVAGISLFKEHTIHKLYRAYRHNLARSILLGLELLVAGDIIRSVAGDLSFDTVVVLGMIVLIRSLISIEFEMEIEGRWPWKRPHKESI